MKKVKFKIPIYDYDVTFVEVEFFYEKEQVVKELKSIKCSQEGIDEVIECFDMKTMNGGWTFRNLDLAKFVVIILPCKDEVTRRNVVNHEKRHIEDRLMEHCNVSDIEAAAYIAGFISKYVY